MFRGLMPNKWCSQVAVTGDRKGRGVNELAVEGLVSRFTFGWTGTCTELVWACCEIGTAVTSATALMIRIAGNCPDLIRLIQEGKIQAWNLPLGAGECLILSQSLSWLILLLHKISAAALQQGSNILGWPPALLLQCHT